jgi:hypothetical protein
MVAGMSFSRLRLLGSFIVAVVLAVGAILAMSGDARPAAYAGSGVLCFAAPLAALSLWRALRRHDASPSSYELGPALPSVQFLHLGAWAGIATGSAIWVLAAATLPFEAKGGFWVLGSAGVAVGCFMAALMLWSLRHPFPAVRADGVGVSIGGGLVTPWRDIDGLRFRRSATNFSHVEIVLRDGETLRPQVPLTVGVEDLEAFFAVVGRHLPRSEPLRFAQALQ